AMISRMSGLFASRSADAGVTTTSTDPRVASSAMSGVVKTTSPRNDVWMTREPIPVRQKLPSADFADSADKNHGAPGEKQQPADGRRLAQMTTTLFFFYLRQSAPICGLLFRAAGVRETRTRRDSSQASSAVRARRAEGSASSVDHSTWRTARNASCGI